MLQYFRKEQGFTSTKLTDGKKRTECFFAGREERGKS